MHEVSVISGIIDAILEELGGYDIEEVEEVVLIVGEMTRLGEEQLCFAYDIMSRDTLLEGSTLTIVHEILRVKCTSCGREGGVDYISDEFAHDKIPILKCPDCGAAVDILEGKSCLVKTLKVIER